MLPGAYVSGRRKNRSALSRSLSLAPLLLAIVLLNVGSRWNAAWALKRKLTWHGILVGSRNDAAFVEKHKDSVPSIDLEEYFRTQKIEVEKALDASLTGTPLFASKLVDAMRYSLLAGGKRIRPIICLAAYDMVAGTNVASGSEVAMPAAVAIEMIHTMSLIHDDLPSMDNDSLRRGMPSNHIKYGEDIAILAGDALLAEAFSHIVHNTPNLVPSSRVVQVIEILSDAVGRVGLTGGQVHDLECEAKPCVSQEELQWIHEHKTASLLEVAAMIGALLAGGSETEVAACRRYGRAIGLAFQVADDILDVTQSSVDLGKTAGKDDATDKTTYVKLLGLEGAQEEGARLRAEAVSVLKPFGSKAGPLIAIAEYIVQRTS